MTDTSNKAMNIIQTAISESIITTLVNASFPERILNPRSTANAQVIRNNNAVDTPKMTSRILRCLLCFSSNAARATAAVDLSFNAKSR